MIASVCEVFKGYITKSEGETIMLALGLLCFYQFGIYLRMCRMMT